MKQQWISETPEEQELVDRFLAGIPIGSSGFVKLDNFMGSDEKLVETARVSTGRGFVSWYPYSRCSSCKAIFDIEKTHPLSSDEMPGCLGTVCGPWENFPIGDQQLINTMVRERHTSPIEFGEIVFRIKIPMDIWRQLVRHRTASVSEYSTRYTEAIDDMATTNSDEWRLQSKSNRQGSSGTLLPADGHFLSEQETKFHQMAKDIYKGRLKLGVAKEQARKDLPLSNYTELYFKMDSHNLMHLLGLRLDSHAQKETRDYANAFYEIFKFLFPRLAWAFEEYRLYSVTFSRTEIAELKRFAQEFQGTLRSRFSGVGNPFYGKEKTADLNRFLAKLGLR